MRNALLFASFLLIGFLISFFSLKKAVKSEKPLRIHSDFSLSNPPLKSLKGSIASFSGEVLWQSRTASEGSALTEKRMVVQGEELLTKESASVQLSFPQVCEVTLLPLSDVGIIQTLPVNFVFNQAEGNVVYKKLGTTPLSIRVMHLLVVIQEGEAKLSMDRERQQSRISIISGSSEVAFEDLEQNTVSLSISQGKEYVFNDKTRRGVLRNYYQ